MAITLASNVSSGPPTWRRYHSFRISEDFIEASSRTVSGFSSTLLPVANCSTRESISIHKFLLRHFQICAQLTYANRNFVSIASSRTIARSSRPLGILWPSLFFL